MKYFRVFDFMFQPNALLVYYIFSYSSTCFEPYCVHHQEDLLYIHRPSLYHTKIYWRNKDYITLHYITLHYIDPPDDEHNMARNM